MKKLFLSISLKIYGQLAGLLVSIIIGYFWGKTVLGEYEYIIRISQFVIVSSVFGFDKLLLKGNLKSKDNKIIEGYEVKQIAFKFILIILSLFGLLYSLFFLYDNSDKSKYIQYAIILSFPMSYNLIFGSLMAVKNQFLSYLVINEFVGKSLVILTLVILSKTIISESVDVLFVLIFFIHFVIFFINIFYSNNSFKNLIWPIAFKVKEFKTIFMEVYPMALVTFIYTGIILFINVFISLNFDYKVVADFSISLRIVAVTTLPMMLVTNLIGPKIKELYNQKKTQEINVMLNSYNLFFLFCGLFFILLILFFAKYLLNLWGKEMIEGYYILLILSIGQTFNLITGIAGPIMNLLDKQILNLKITAITYIIFLLILFVLKINSVIYIVLLFSCSIAVENLIKTFLLMKSTQIRTFYGIR